PPGRDSHQEDREPEQQEPPGPGACVGTLGPVDAELVEAMLLGHETRLVLRPGTSRVQRAIGFRIVPDAGVHCATWRHGPWLRLRASCIYARMTKWEPRGEHMRKRSIISVLVVMSLTLAPMSFASAASGESGRCPGPHDPIESFSFKLSAV